MIDTNLSNFRASAILKMVLLKLILFSLEMATKSFKLKTLPYLSLDELLSFTAGYSICSSLDSSEEEY
jgi:hypothetical protein